MTARVVSHRSGNTGTRTDWYDADAEAEWKNLSRVTYATRMLGLASRTNTALNEASKADPRTPFAPLYPRWVIDNLVFDGRHEEAFRAAGEWAKEWSDYRLMGRPLLPVILSQQAECARVLGSSQEAAHLLEQVIHLEASSGAPTATPWFRLGEVAYEAGNTTRAISAFRRAARLPGEELLPQLAYRKALDLERGTPWARSCPAALARELIRALRTKDSHALWELASKTHYSFGEAGGHFTYVDPRTVLEPLIRDLKQSRVWGHPEKLEGAGAKRYLLTNGWCGDVFVGRVQLLIRETWRGEWSWVGVSTEARTEETNRLFDRTFGVARPATNHRIEISIKAPWPRDMSFQAGGWRRYVALGSIGIAADPFSALGTWFSSAQRSCGFGFSGLYYNDPTHENKPPYDDGVATRWDGSSDAFAIDFARWERHNLVPKNLSAGVPVLACHDGVVASAWGPNRRGDDAQSNRVEQTLVDFWGAPTRYAARYLHLDGPDMLAVSQGFWVEQGFMLGLMDDTGDSLHDHLHFELRDSREVNANDAAGNSYGATVRPNPMDGYSLDDADEGHCVTSSNVMVEPRTYCDLLLRYGGLTPVEGAILCNLRGVDPSPPDPMVFPKAFCQWRAARATADDRDELLAVCARLPDDPPDPALFPKAYCFWQADQTGASNIACHAMPEDPPDPRRYPKAYCTFVADRAPSIERAELLRLCGAMPDDPERPPRPSWSYRFSAERTRALGEGVRGPRRDFGIDGE